MNISIMYHTPVNKQVFFNKQISLNKDFVYDYSQIVNNNYVNTLTRSQKKIFNFIQRFQYFPFIKLTNETIARHTGCSRITVIRATNKFHQDGFITKYQQNPYAPNFFSLNDTHNKRSLILDNLFINSSLRTRTHARKEFKKNEIRFRSKYRQTIKGGRMTNFDNQFPNMAKNKQKKRYDGGHSPAVVKPVLSLEEQIIKLTNDIKSLSNKIELNKEPAYMISYAMNLVEHKIKELRELKALHDSTTIYH